MLKRTVKVQLAIFVVFAVVTMTYVAVTYVGIGKGLFKGGGCTVHAEFPDSGGIFTNAEVTYRGVSVGSVGPLTLLDDGVRVQLDIDDCGKSKIPATAYAQVTNRSAIGEQYVNLVPPNNEAPYLKQGDLIPMERNKLPVATDVLLTNLNRLVTSVNTEDLAITVSELGKAFNGRGPDLQLLLDSGDSLLEAANAALPETLALIRSSNTVLTTQLEMVPHIRQWVTNLDLLTEALRESDPDLRRLVDQGPADLEVLRRFVDANAGDLGAVLANLDTVGTVVTRHIDSVRFILEAYPAMAAGGNSVVPGDGTAHVGLVLDQGVIAPTCLAGYEGTAKRVPGDTTPRAPNTAARCIAPPPTNRRGANDIPGGDPVYTGGGGFVYPRVLTENMVRVGNVGGAAVLGDSSWLALLNAGLH